MCDPRCCIPLHVHHSYHGRLAHMPVHGCHEFITYHMDYFQRLIDRPISKPPVFV